MIPRFLIAKYVPALNRMEPRNIGVLLWSRGEIGVKFLPPDDAAFVNDKQAYNWWVQRWTKIAAADEIRGRRGQSVSKRKVESLDVLLGIQEGSFLLVDAGELLEEITKKEMGPALDFLFGELVAPYGPGVDRLPSKQASQQMHDKCLSLFKAVGVADGEDFHDGYSQECAVYGVIKHLRFNYAIANGKPKALFQQVKLRSEQSVNNAALTLHAVTEHAVIERDSCAALLRENDIQSAGAEEAYEWLRQICPVVDIESSAAVGQLGRILGTDGGGQRPQ